MIAQQTKSVIDCSDNNHPIIPGGEYSFHLSNQLRHRIVSKTFVWDMLEQSDKLYFGPGQRDKMTDDGAALCKIFQNEDFAVMWRLLPARVAHFLVENPEQIPMDFLGKCIPFWGTIYHLRDAPIDYVMCLDLIDEIPKIKMLPTGGHFGPKNPAIFTKVMQK